MTAAVPTPPAVVSRTELKIDLGCGTRKAAGFLGVDILAFEGVDLILDIARDRWPWDDGSVTEANASHVLEHLTQPERCHFFNELYRVLAVGAKCVVQTPHWASTRAYGDPTHVWPPVSEFAYFYLDASWRKTQAPHTESMLRCDFHASWGYMPSQDLLTRSAEYQQFALQNYKEAALDLVATLTKR